MSKIFPHVPTGRPVVARAVERQPGLTKHPVAGKVAPPQADQTGMTGEAIAGIVVSLFVLGVVGSLFYFYGTQVLLIGLVFAVFWLFRNPSLIGGFILLVLFSLLI